MGEAFIWGFLAGLCFAAGTWTTAKAICSQKRTFLPLASKLLVGFLFYLALRHGVSRLGWSLLGFSVGSGFVFFCLYVVWNRLARKKHLS